MTAPGKKAPTKAQLAQFGGKIAEILKERQAQEAEEAKARAEQNAAAEAERKAWRRTDALEAKADSRMRFAHVRDMASELAKHDRIGTLEPHVVAHMMYLTMDDAGRRLERSLIALGLPMTEPWFLDRNEVADPEGGEL